jgi:tetratricopeptide (TPR) repeat protein
MGWFTKKHKKDDPAGSVHLEPRARASSDLERMPYQVPTSDEEIEQSLRDIEEANRMVAGNAALQEAFARVTGEEPSPRPPSLEELRDRATAGGLSYIMGPPADLPEVSPEAARLHMEGAMGALTGDDASSLAKFGEALALVRAIGHERAEARLLYNAGVAHYKLGDHQRAIEVLAEGKTVAERISADLRREARKLQRFEEERKIDEPRLEVFGTPDLEQKLLEMFLEALATVYDAIGLPTQASTCRAEVERLHGATGQ